MKKNSYDYLNDGIINIYKQGIFLKCFEYSAVLLSEITGYKLCPSIDKKTGFVFLELGIPIKFQDKIIEDLEKKGYGLRIVESSGSVMQTFGTQKNIIDSKNLIQLKNNLVKFS